MAGQRRESLTQCLDIPATIVDILGKPDGEPDTQPLNVNYSQGSSLLTTLASDKKVREYALYGLFGAALNITDGTHTYFLYPEDCQAPLHEYTMMPVHPASFFTLQEFSNAELVHNMAFGNGYPMMKLPALDSAKRPPMQGGEWGDAMTVLYNLQEDPLQQHPLSDSQLENTLRSAINAALLENHAPSELFQRFAL